MNKWVLILAVFCCTSTVGQVNLQTGAAQMSFPIFEYQDSKSRLSTELSLAYIAGNGLKVNELASSVGTGWALRAGGSITRIQNGEPDDQVGYSIVSSNYDAISYFEYDYPSGYLYTTRSPLNNPPVTMSHSPQFPVSYERDYKPNFEDREQDVFAFQFNGRLGKFVIGKNKVPKILNDSKLAISFVETNREAEQIRTRISSFLVTDEAGIQYKFSECEVVESVNYAIGYIVISNRISIKGTPAPNGRKRRVVTKWYLKEVINPITSEKIVFNYDDFSVDLDGPKHITRQVVDGQGKSSQVTVHERLIMTSKRLSSIIFPDPHRIDFIYATTNRVDYAGEKSLNEIRIKYGDKLLYGYQFNYGYFFKNQIVSTVHPFQPADIRFARLCLKDFRKMGSDGTFLPPHEFTYNIPTGSGNDIIPPMFSLYSDQWGYYNQFPTFVNEGADGYPTNSLVAKSFSAYTTDAKNGIIKSIKYPEGGVLEWEYEINQSESSTLPQKYAGGVRVNKTRLYDGETHDNDIVKAYRYVNENGNSSSWGFEVPRFSESKGLRQYRLNGMHNGGECFKDLAAGFVNKLFYFGPQSIASQSVSGGLFGGNFSQQVAFDVFAAWIVAQIIDIIFSEAYKDFTLSIVKSDNLNEINALPFQYARVEVVDEIWSGQTLAGTNGKVAYEFTSAVDYPIPNAGTFPGSFSSGKPRVADFQYGLPKTTTWYNAANQPVKKAVNEYSSIVRSNTGDNNHVSRSTYVSTVLSGSWEMFTVAFKPEFLVTEIYYPVEGRLELTKTIEYVYNKEGASTSFETNYTYSSANFLPRTISKKDSKGDIIGTTTFYVADYNNVLPIMDAMRSANMMNVPVSENAWVKGASDATRQLTASVVTEFAQMANFDIRPFQVYKSELSAPVGNSIVEPNDINFDQGNFKNYAYLKPQQAILYANGNPVQQINSNGNINTAVLYDYSNRIIVGEVVNAAATEVMYTSFEGDNSGGWLYSSAGIVNAFSVTGRKNFDLSTGVINSLTSVAVNKPMVVTLWATQGHPGLNVAGVNYVPAKTGPTINGWTYYEYELPSINGSITISGNGFLDELRLYPKNARMSTYAYDPGIGKTADCDENSIINYYEYDVFGRIKTVRDQYRNLIKAYEYNYKQ